jgi:hypothetical protein
MVGVVVTGLSAWKFHFFAPRAPKRRGDEEGEKERKEAPSMLTLLLYFSAFFPAFLSSCLPALHLYFLLSWQENPPTSANSALP